MQKTNSDELNSFERKLVLFDKQIELARKRRVCLFFLDKIFA